MSGIVEFSECEDVIARAVPDLSYRREDLLSFIAGRRRSQESADDLAWDFITVLRVEQIEEELVRLGWNCTAEDQTRFVVIKDDEHPGWVTLADDYSEFCGGAGAILAALQRLDDSAEYGHLSL